MSHPTNREPGAEPRCFLALYPVGSRSWAVDFNDGIHWTKQNRVFLTKWEAEAFADTLPKEV